MTVLDFIAGVAGALGGVASLVAIVVGVRALTDAHGARLDAARDRQRQVLSLIADELERMNKAAWVDMQTFPQRNDWRDGIKLLDRYLHMVPIDLPRCLELTQQGGPVAAALVIVAARQEVVGHLAVLAVLDAAALTPKESAWQRLIRGTSAC